MTSAAFESDINLNCVVHLTTSQQGWNIDQKLTAMSVQAHSVSLPVMSESFPFIYYLETYIQDLKWFLGSCLGSCQWYSGPTAPEYGPQRGAVPELLSVRMRRLDRAARHSRNQLAPQCIQYPERRAGDCAQGLVTSTSHNHDECYGFVLISFKQFHPVGVDSLSHRSSGDGK